MTRIEEAVDNLFRDAESKGGVQYIYTLLRVTGPNLRQKDQLLELQADVSGASSLSRAELFAKYCVWIGLEEPLELLANLLNCAEGRPYSVAPFSHLNTGEFPNIHFADPDEKIRNLPELASSAHRPELAHAIEMAYRSDLLDCCAENSPPSLEEVDAVFRDFQSLWIPLLNRYFAERLKYRHWPRFHKVSPFMVIELLTNEGYGLYG